MPTIRELAKIAGVSIATVSRALSGSRRMNPELRARILELAELYQYTPNRLSQAAISGNSTLVGCVIPTVSHAFTGSILQGILGTCQAADTHVITLETQAVPAHTSAALLTLAELRVAGVIMDSGHGELVPRDVMLRLRSLDIPLITLEPNSTAIPVDRVGNDERDTSAVAIAYLTGLGHREIAFFGPNTPNVEHRCAVFRETMRGKGLPPLRVLDTNQGFDAALRQLLTVTPRPTAIFVNDDDRALLLMQALLLRGYHIPRDFSILGCGNMPYGAYVIPPLTTVEQYPVEAGRQAAELLLRRMREKDPQHAVEEIIIPVRLTERSSCARPARVSVHP